MKTKLMLLIAVMWLTYHPATAQPTAPPSRCNREEIKKPEIGYWVVYSTNGHKEQPVKTTDIHDVYVIAELCFPGNCINFHGELQSSPYFAVESQPKYFYVEVKRINRNGHYRRLSNREFNQLKMKN